MVSVTQAADRFMHTMEDQSGLEHLIVFITSNVNLEDKVLELQRRSFKIIVLYHVPYVNQQPLNVIKAADEAHDWLPFLQCKMDTTELSISTYDAHVFHSGEVPGALATDTPMYIQTQQNHPSTMDQVCHCRSIGQCMSCAMGGPESHHTLMLGSLSSTVWQGCPLQNVKVHLDSRHVMGFSGQSIWLCMLSVFCLTKHT